MPDIICAIRAGEGSRAVQNAAISAAQRRNGGLVFLYVIDHRILEVSDDSVRPSVRSELYWMGRTLVRIAVARAQAAGLRDACWAIREGDVGEEIARAVVENGAQVLFMGASRQAASGRPNSAASLADRLRTTTGVAVDVVLAREQGQHGACPNHGSGLALGAPGRRVCVTHVSLPPVPETAEPWNIAKARKWQEPGGSPGPVTCPIQGSISGRRASTRA